MQDREERIRAYVAMYITRFKKVAERAFTDGYEAGWKDAMEQIKNTKDED